MSKLSKSMHNQNVQQINFRNQNSFLLVGIGLWSIIGLGLMLVYGHYELVFLIVILIWLLVAVIFLFFSMHWKGWSILLIPILTITSYFPVAYLYIGYREWVADRALDQFITAAAVHNIPERFFIQNNELTRLDKNVSLEYEIVGKDNFYEVREWLIRFENGTVYRITMVPNKFSKWRVSAFQQ